MAIVKSITYEDAETRGKLRAWKKKLVADYVILDGAYRSFLTKDREIIRDMVLRSRKGRERAFEKIKRALGPGVRLEYVDLDGKESAMATFSILKPRDAVLKPSPPHLLAPSMLQDCVTVNYFHVGFLPGFLDGVERIGAAEGLWTLEVPDHALGRAVERSRYLHPGALIYEAHANLLRLPASVLYENGALVDSNSKGALLKAGAGYFVTHVHVAPDVSSGGELCVHVRVKTWLDESMLGDDQIPLRGESGEGERIGDGWLLPFPLRAILPDKDGSIRCFGWKLNRKEKDSDPRRQAENSTPRSD